MRQAGIWIITALTIFAILIRPKRWAEAVWACVGAALLILFGYLSPRQALFAVDRGTDVYLFLAGMMLLAELARRQGLFDWLASHAVRAAKGSQARLFALVYAVGIAVTALLSNDATAVVLTPAVYAAVKKARASALPYLFICAFIANAASFLLPISNPANLVIFGNTMPPLAGWLRSFALASFVAIAATYAALRFLARRELRAPMELDVEYPTLSAFGLLVAWGIAGTAALLLAVSALGGNLGLPTLLAALVVLAAVLFTGRDSFGHVIRHISWGVLPLVAGLFVLVQGLDSIGAVGQTREVLHHLESGSPAPGAFIAAFGIALACNIGNNLPLGLLAGSAVQEHHFSTLLQNALVIGVDLGPNLSPTGSLATILWLIALRREGEHVSAWTFIKYGLLVMPPALLLATCALLLSIPSH